MKRAFFDFRRPSLSRGNLLVAVSVLIAFGLSDFPRNRATLLLVFPLIGATMGTVDTLRCLQPRWNLYHGTVMLCLYTDLMAVSLVLFSLLYPYVVRLAH